MLNNNSSNNTTVRPQHHLHDTSDPLPGAKGAAPAFDYSPSTMDRTPSSALKDDGGAHTGLGEAATQGKNAFNTERPLNVQPTSQGGVAIGGKADLPEGKASFGDKVIGKTQKVVGKYTHNPEMHEKGELRETGGKAAALGQARAAHD